MLELGSGTGLVGLVAGYLGARVCITDQAYVISFNHLIDTLTTCFFFYAADSKSPLIPIMKRNILLNGLQSHVTAIELDWCVCYLILKFIAPRFTRALFQFYLIIVRAKPIPELPQPPDIVLAADCIYLEATFPLLVSTLVALVPTPPGRAPEVLLSYKKRRKADKRFFALLKTHFTWSSVVRDFDNQDKEKEKKELCVRWGTCATKIKGLFGRSMTMISTVLKRDKTEVESRCCVCFAARKRERSQLPAANDLIVVVSPPAAPQCLPYDLSGRYASLCAHTYLINYYQTMNASEARRDPSSHQYHRLMIFCEYEA